MTRIARLIALPIVSAGIIGGAALGLAGTAGAAVSVDNNGGIVATPPDIHAHQQMIYPMRHGLYYWPTQAHAPPHVDTTVHQSR